MRTKSTGGFTLIELLIVIAIIGILAAVLIPNLMNARQSATQRAGQAHSSNVYTAYTAALADDPQATVASVITDGGADCQTGDTVGNYSYNDGPSGGTCGVAANAAGTDFVVTVTAGGRTYTNGRDTTTATP